MKKLLGAFLVFLMLAMPFVTAVGVGESIPLVITPEQFVPRVFLDPNARVVLDDYNEPGAVPGTYLVERIENYAFEGEQIQWEVLVWDKNGKDKISDVFVTLNQGTIGVPTTEERTLEYCDSLPYRSGFWTDDLELPRFDPSLGELQSVDMEFSTYMAATLGVENPIDQDANYTANFNGQIDLTTPDGQPLQSLIDWSQGGVLGPFDGAIDYTGPSGVFYDNILDEAVIFHSPTDLTAYEGVGIMSMPVSTSSSYSVIGPGDMNTQVRTNFTASACVEYTYLVETIGYAPGESEIEANCFSIAPPVVDGKGELGNLEGLIYEGEEKIKWEPGTMQWYRCIFTVETPESMHGQYVIVAGAEDISGQYGESAETEYWFLNPVIAMGISGSINFGTVRPGAVVKSTPIRITNNAEYGSGVLLDMYIAGTDFYDPSHSAAMCPDSNVLKLKYFSYYATLGSYKTCTYPVGTDIVPWVDSECYVSIPYYMDGAGSPGNNNMQRIIDGTVDLLNGEYPAGNVLSPEADMSINFKLKVPEPCNGGAFSHGSFKIFGEAI